MVLMHDEGMDDRARGPLLDWWRGLSRQLKLTIFICGVITFVAAVGIGTWAYANRPIWPDPTLVTAAQSATYPIYYPSQLPQGFSTKVGKISNSNGVFIYVLQYDGNKQLFVSAVPKPAGVQFDDFYNRVLSNKQSVLNPLGTAVIGNANNQPMGSLVTDKTWVTMNTPNGIDTTRLQALVSSLKQL